MDGDRVRSGLQSAFAPGFAEVPDVFVEDLRGDAVGRRSRAATTAIDDYLQERPLAARLGALPVPVTVVFGEEDGVDPASLSDYDGVAGVEVERLPGVGHTPIWEAPEAVAEVIARRS